jgi:hypothetical protein
LALVHSASRSALTLARAFFEIPTFSSHVASYSSLRVSSSSHVRSSSYNSSTTTISDVDTAGLGGGGGGANKDKSTMHQETSSAAIRNGQNPTFSQHAPSGRPPSSSSGEVVVTCRCGLNPHPRDISHDHRHGQSP